MVDAMAFAGTPAEVYAKVQEWGQYVDGIALGGGMNVPPEVAREHVGRIVDTFAR
jgi:alkanesulfonate monooxygenase SsuD/methylene tetrahydromethanopterin reductase-like flavin-dependent oxidoreductase (luciferase family)